MLFKHASNWNQTTGTANMHIPLATVFMGEIYKAGLHLDGRTVSMLPLGLNVRIINPQILIRICYT